MALVPSGVVTVTSTVPTVWKGDVAVIEESEVTVNGAVVAPKSTAVAPVKPVPLMVTVVPPVAGPEVGLTPSTVGGVNVYRSAAPVALVPPGAVTVTSTAPTGSAGVVAVIDVSDVTTNGAEVAPKSTIVDPVKPVPVIVTAVPPVAGPDVGRKEVTMGAETALAGLGAHTPANGTARRPPALDRGQGPPRLLGRCPSEHAGCPHFSLATIAAGCRREATAPGQTSLRSVAV